MWMWLIVCVSTGFLQFIAVTDNTLQPSEPVKVAEGYIRRMVHKPNEKNIVAVVSNDRMTRIIKVTDDTSK
jgi:hypothetical protein